MVEAAPNDPLPWYLAHAIRFGVEPKDWLELLACFERAYQNEINNSGRAKAKWWATQNTFWLIYHGLLALPGKLLGGS
jgi:hypothetical protein